MKRRNVLIVTGLLAWLPLTVFANGTAEDQTRVATLQELGFKETGYPIVTQPYTLKVFHMSRHQDTPNFDMLDIFKKLEEKTGIHVEWEYAGADWSTQKPLLLVSGTLPDVFFSRSLNESDIINNRELFIPMDDLIAKYGPNIRAMFREDPAMEKMSRAFDGKIYGLPQKMPHRPAAVQVMGINSDWLNKLGLKMPATTDELYTVLKAFKERDPNGNGKADEIPVSFMGTDPNRNIMNLLAPFGIVTSGDHWLSVNNGKVQYIAAQDGFKDGVAWLHKLYAEGLLDQEVFTQNRNMLASKTNPPGRQPEIVGLSGQWSRAVHFGAQRVEHYPMLMPLKGPKGHQLWSNAPETTQGSKYMYEITRNCKHPEIAMRWADALYDQLTSMELFFGPEGITWTANSNGTYTWRQQPSDFKGNWQWNFGLNDQAPGFTSDRVSDKIIFQQAAEEQQYQDKLLLAPYFPKEWYPPVSFTPDEINALAILRTDIHSIATQKFALWVTRGGIEREYDDFIRQLGAMGLPRMLAIYQQAYDRYVKN